MAQSRIEITAVDRTRAAFSSARGGLQSLGRQVLNVRNLVVGLAGIGGFGLLIKKSFEAVDANAKLADRLGVTTEKLAGLRHAADLAGVSESALITGTRMLAQNLADAARGTGEAAVAFNAMGINAQQLLSLPMDEQLSTILERLASVENVTLRNAYAADIFGGRASEMLNLIADGAEGIRKATEDSIAWGKALDRIDSAKIEQANDAVTRSQGALSGMANLIAVEVSPVVTALNNQFADMVAENNGFRDQIADGMQTIATAIGYVANVLQGLNFAWAGLKVAAGTAIDFIIQGVANLDRVLTDLANKFSGSFIGEKLGLEASQYNEALQMMADVSRERLIELKTEFDAIALEGLPKERIEEWFRKVREEAQKTAEATAASRAGMAGGAGIGIVNDEQAAAEFAKYEERLAQRIQKLSESFLTENELRQQQLEQTNLMLEESWVLGQITTEERHRLEQEALIRHQAAMGDIEAQGILARRRFEEMNAAQRTSFVLNEMVALTQGVAAQNKLLFKINKLAAIAKLGVEMPAAIGSAIERGGGLPWGAVFGALTAAKYIALIAQAKRAEFGTSTSAPSIGGGGAVPVTPAEGLPQLSPLAQTERPRVFNITLSGSGRYSAEEVRDLLEQIEEEIGDGALGNASFVAS